MHFFRVLMMLCVAIYCHTMYSMEGEPPRSQRSRQESMIVESVDWVTQNMHPLSSSANSLVAKVHELERKAVDILASPVANEEAYRLAKSLISALRTSVTDAQTEALTLTLNLDSMQNMNIGGSLSSEMQQLRRNIQNVQKRLQNLLDDVTKTTKAKWTSCKDSCKEAQSTVAATDEQDLQESFSIREELNNSDDEEEITLSRNAQIHNRTYTFNDHSQLADRIKRHLLTRSTNSANQHAGSQHSPQPTHITTEDSVVTTQATNTSIPPSVAPLEQEEANQCLIYAVKTNHISRATEALNAGADIDVRDETGDTLALWAIRNKRFELAKKLLDAGADIRLVDTAGATVCLLAAKQNCPEIINWLLQQGTPINFTDTQGYTSLHYAAQSNALDAVKLLLEHGANVDIKSTDSLAETPLHRAARWGCLDVARALVNANASVHSTNSRGETAFHLAASNGAAEIIRILTAAGARIESRDHEGTSPLSVASRSSHQRALEVVQLLIEELHADITTTNNRGNYLLSENHRPLSLTRETIILYLRQTLNNRLLAATQTADSQAVALLLRAGADPNAQGNFFETPLHIACRMNNGYLIQYLVQAGSDVNARDRNNNTPYALIPQTQQTPLGQSGAAETTPVPPRREYNAAATRRLLAAVEKTAYPNQEQDVNQAILDGADVNGRGNEEKRPLHFAAHQGHLNLVKILLAAGADVKALKIYGGSPLHRAAEQGHPAIAQILLDAGSDINLCTTLKGSTPLHHAAREGHFDVVQLLVARGARTDLKNSDGQIAKTLEIASYLGWPFPQAKKQKSQPPQQSPQVRRSNDGQHKACRKKARKYNC